MASTIRDPNDRKLPWIERGAVFYIAGTVYGGIVKRDLNVCTRAAFSATV